MDDVWAWASSRSICRHPSLTPSSWLASLPSPQPFTHPPPPACSYIGPTLLFRLPFFSFLLLSIWFIFAVPSCLPFQKVMHTRKRHSELYHELNHSSKFHTIDRYSRDAAMSTFKVRPLPKSGVGNSLYPRTSTPPHTLSLNPPPPPPSLLTLNNRLFFTECGWISSAL